MTIPHRFTFEITNDQYLEWGPLTDALTAVPITDATVTASLYSNRIIGDPSNTGTIVPTFGSAGVLSLPHVSVGVYRGLIQETFVTTVGTNYVTVIDAATPGGANGHWEILARVQPRTKD